MNKKTIFGLSLIALGLSGAAYAAAPQQAGDPMGDKTVTKAEFMARHGEMFDKMDANRDGKLDQADRAAHMGQMFDMADTDRNGSLSREEFAAAHQRGGEGMGGKRGERRGEGKAAGGHRGGRMMMGMMRMADTDKDNAVSRDEFLAMAGQHFDKMDANKDGQLTAQERKAGMAQMKGKRGGRGGHGGHGGHGDMPPPPPAG